MATKRAQRRARITAIPLVLVNLVAFFGQFAYIQEHVQWPGIAQVVFAIALESVALFLAYMANQALMSQDSAYGLRLSSYVFGFIIGFMNYSHYAPGFHPTFEAVATGLMSLASPWLWGIYSRRQHRDLLYAKRLLSPRAVKLGFLRWVLWPGRSWKVFRWAAWTGTNEPDEVLAHFAVAQAAELAAEQAQKAIEAAPDLNPIEAARSKSEAVRIALNELGDAVTSAVVSEWLNQRGWDVKPNIVRMVKARDNKADVS